MDPISNSTFPIVEIKPPPKKNIDLSPPESKSEAAC